MEYRLQFGSDGKFFGFQEVECVIEGSTVVENQYFDQSGFRSDMSFINVFADMNNYIFEVSDWGTMELAREAAERYAANDCLNCVITKQSGEGSYFTRWSVVPNNEDYMVLA